MNGVTIPDRTGCPIVYRYLSAIGLIDFYQEHGYRFVEFIQWKETNYRSMIFAKSLAQ